MGRRTALASLKGGYLINVGGFMTLIFVHIHMHKRVEKIEPNDCPLPLAFLSVYIYHLTALGHR